MAISMMLCNRNKRWQPACCPFALNPTSQGRSSEIQNSRNESLISEMLRYPLFRAECGGIGGDIKMNLGHRSSEPLPAYIGCVRGYCRGNGAVKQVFGDDVDYATETKVWGRTNADVSRYFNPLVVIGIKRRMRIGTPDLSKATTCHAERTNLSVRTFTRRFTRSQTS